MAEAFGIATGVLQVAGFGAALGGTLFKCAKAIRHANKELETIAVQVQATSKSLDAVGALLCDPDTKDLHTPKLYEDTTAVSKGCQEVFCELEKAVNAFEAKSGKGKYQLTVLARLQWPLSSGRLSDLQKVLKHYSDVLHLMLAVLQIVEGRRAATKEELRGVEAQLQSLAVSNSSLSEANKSLSETIAAMTKRPKDDIQSTPMMNFMALAPGIPAPQLQNGPQPRSLTASPSLPTDRSLPKTATTENAQIGDQLRRCMIAVQELATSLSCAMNAWQGQDQLVNFDFDGTCENVGAQFRTLHPQLQCKTCKRLVTWSNWSRTGLARSVIGSADKCPCYTRASSDLWTPAKEIEPKKPSEVSTFLGAGSGAIIGDAIFTGLGTLGGAILGGIGGHEYGKDRQRRSARQSGPSENVLWPPSHDPRPKSTPPMLSHRNERADKNEIRNKFSELSRVLASLNADEASETVVKFKPYVPTSYQGSSNDMTGEAHPDGKPLVESHELDESVVVQPVANDDEHTNTPQDDDGDEKAREVIAGRLIHGHIVDDDDLSASSPFKSDNEDVDQGALASSKEHHRESLPPPPPRQQNSLAWRNTGLYVSTLPPYHPYPHHPVHHTSGSQQYPPPPQPPTASSDQPLVSATYIPGGSSFGPGVGIPNLDDTRQQRSDRPSSSPIDQPLNPARRRQAHSRRSRYNVVPVTAEPQKYNMDLMIPGERLTYSDGAVSGTLSDEPPRRAIRRHALPVEPWSSSRYGSGSRSDYREPQRRRRRDDSRSRSRSRSRGPPPRNTYNSAAAVAAVGALAGYSLKDRGNIDSIKLQTGALRSRSRSRSRSQGSSKRRRYSNSSVDGESPSKSSDDAAITDKVEETTDSPAIQSLLSRWIGKEASSLVLSEKQP